ncbi:hypothetical protein [Chryseobacterium pennipullorum]|uniref:Uncharacterized protein n=1 Tax=Chryseobacterium pennipullorum TaxID=2258963 RepID=A0A3D9B4K5_9FLAO|nr:hypothetical protein [Chryseobacterium pennipullorum]REC48267.1 hypothetical protein DRF67_07990 [Chryseobacterium pennipullorum]
MNNKIKFFLPRLLGITVVVGAALFLLSIIFKLLLAGLVLAGIGMFAVKIMGNRREKQMKYGQDKIEFLPYHKDFAKPQEPVNRQMSKENLAIIPIQ